MNIQECREFVDKVSPYKLHVKYSNEPEMKYWAAMAGVYNGTDTIFLSRSLFMHTDYLFQITVLLHEIGHFVHKDKQTLSDRELYAELWGIKKANSMKLYSVKRYAIEAIRDWETRWSWNKDKNYRRYIIASKKYNRMKGPKNGKVNTFR